MEEGQEGERGGRCEGDGSLTIGSGPHREGALQSVEGDVEVMTHHSSSLMRGRGGTVGGWGWRGR